jgi:ATP-dependent DNA helicase RecG
MTDRLQEVVQVLARPIQFASQDSYAHLATVKNLGSFVSQQITRALAQQVRSSSVEADLLTLRQLFADYADDLPASEQKTRLVRARSILRRLGARFPALGDDALAEETHPVVELWNVPIRFAKGVGPKRASLLEKLGIRTVEDALWFIPRRYEDRSAISAIGAVTPGVQVTVCGTVGRTTLKRIPGRRLSILDVLIGDDTGSLHAVFFNQPYLENVLIAGRRVMLSGTASAGRRGWTDIRLEAPQYELVDDDADAPIHVGRIVPVYHETRGLTSRQIRAILKELLDQYLGAVEEALPAGMRERHRFPRLAGAIGELHFPGPQADLRALERGTSVAHRRLAFEEFFLLELALALRHRTVKDEVKGIRFTTQTPLIGRLKTLLPFRLTSAQERVIGEILRDMGSPRPMNRLIQGDVGSGKTIVALHAMLVACGSGYQAALMAPTEILAEQHALTIRPMLEALGLPAVLLTSRGAAKSRAAALRQIESGEASVVIGTHALIQKRVRFARLGLAVIDEQHKFGVLQRATLRAKGYQPDVLVMTATPIPRTLAMTVYGDLDVSVIDALPPGRTPVRTLLFEEPDRRRAYQLLKDQVRAGRQGYVVYPLVEESEKLDLKAAIQGAQHLQAALFRTGKVGLIHGRMKPDEKERTMAAFKAGTIQVLVATTVIEVGIDVPNASVMLIEHADRFGLAQLHQLRGRVGRGTDQSYCVLLTPSPRRAQDAVEPDGTGRRLQALVRCADGFAVAEEDLRLRGPGEFFGVRQWGLPEFRAASLVRDAALLAQARQEAFALVDQDPRLSRPEHRGMKAAMLRRWSAKLQLSSIS